MTIGIFLDTSVLINLWYNNEEYEKAKKFAKKNENYTFVVTGYGMMEFFYAILRNEVAALLISNKIKPPGWVFKRWNSAHKLFEELSKYDDKLFDKAVAKADETLLKVVEDLDLTIIPATELKEELLVYNLVSALIPYGFHIEDAIQIAMFSILEEPKPYIVITGDNSLYEILNRLREEEIEMYTIEEELIKFKFPIKEVYKWDGFKQKYILE